MDLSLSGRRALVTGAGMGIGRAVAEALAAEGVHVAALDIDEKALAELSAGDGSITGIGADLSTAQGCADGCRSGPRGARRARHPRQQRRLRCRTNVRRAHRRRLGSAPST